MNILIISSSNPYQKAGIVALDLYNGLRDINGHKVKILSRFCEAKDPNIISFLSKISNDKRRSVNFLRRKIAKFKARINPVKTNNPKYLIQDLDQTATLHSTDAMLRKVGMKPDAIIVLFMTNFLSYKNLQELNEKTKAPIYLYPMDMAPFTGGCHYAWDCFGYKRNCGRCPGLNSAIENDQTMKNLEFKKDHIQKTDITLFACNTQINNEIISSSIFSGKKVINGIYPVPDSSIFKPTNKKDAKGRFGIDEDQQVIFFGAVSLADERKGMPILIEALNIFWTSLININYDVTKIILLVAGSDFGVDSIKLKFKIKYIGFVGNYNALSQAYNAADMFVCPSIEETGPTMVLQSILCKTPVVSFNVGYSNEFFAEDRSGLIAKNKTPLDLANCLLKAILMDARSKDEYLNTLNVISQKLSLTLVIEKINSALINN
jgi:glycosyltransferase involved in cell wall biosynthesis